MKNLKKKSISRRDFVKTSAAAGAGVLITSNSVFASPAKIDKKRYVLVGVGSRARMYQRAVMDTFSDHSEMAAFCDVNEGRLKLAQKNAKEKSFWY